MVYQSDSAVILKPGRERSLLRRHPWVFSGAVAEVRGDPRSGETVDVTSAEGKFLAKGAYSPQSQIRVRVWTWEDDEVNADYFRDRINGAIRRRDSLRNTQHEIRNSSRLVYAESDGVPGLIVDRYDDVLVVQLLTAGVEFWRDTIVEQLQEILNPAALFERSDADVRKLEGLPERIGWLSGNLENTRLEIIQDDLRFYVDIEKGHKTGFYLDQAANRKMVGEISSGKEILDCFAYTGGFAAHCLRGGAKHVTLVEDSRDALDLAKENLSLNGFSSEKYTFIDGDAFQVLRNYRDEGRTFDIVILDPPKFAPTKAQAERAARGYKDINLLAFKLLRLGGQLVTFSCSGGVDAALFQKIVAGAALDAGVDARILHRLTQAPDHPVAVNFPEGEYLKGLVVQIN
ncbi:MAG: class I SAM-dependent rRNA methyltransferase [Anaerolineales bacterium]